MRKSLAVVLPLFLLFLVACNNNTRQKKEVAIDKSITPANAFNNLFLDSNKINDFLSAQPEYAAFAGQYQDFYKQRNYEYAWFDTSGIGEQAVNFVNLLSSTIADLNDSSLYSKKMMQLYNQFFTDSTSQRRRKVAAANRIIPYGAVFQYVAKVYNGSDIDAEELGWFIPRKKVDFAALLDSTIANKGKDEDRILPRNKQYQQLQTVLTQYYKIKRKHPDGILYRCLPKGINRETLPQPSCR